MRMIEHKKTTRRTAATRFAWLVLPFALAFAPPQARADAAASMRSALSLADGQDWTGATNAARGAGSVGADIIEWERLRAGGGLLGDYEAFLQRRPDWPGLPLLKEKGEEAVARSTSPERVVAYFGTGKPETSTGSLALIAALRAQNRAADAEAEAFRAWTELAFSPDAESQLLGMYGDMLKVADEVRLDRLLWQGRVSEAKRMLPRVSPGWRALAEARMALRADADGVDAKLTAIPATLQTNPGLAFERFDWRFRRDRTDDAAALVIDTSTSAASLGDPAAWAARRASLARALLREGKAQAAYKVAARHQLTGGGGEYADLEFLAGFIALRRLNDPETALSHFRHLREAVATPISVSRAHYWEGRALAAKGDKAGATAAYKVAAQFQTAYYGLLAAETLGQTLDASLLSSARPADWRGASFAKSSVLDAAMLLSRAGDRTLSKRFFLQVGEKLNAKEMDQLSDLAFQMEEPHIALLIAKQAAERGVILPRAYFPVPDFVPGDLPVSRALALAISRRESEFDPAARSAANARGLMQVLPTTAQHIAPKAGLAFDASRLNEPGYNVRMGTAYLAQLVEQFGPSIALVASGYNAGPGRPKRWIGTFGDPRSPEVDVVDWVEMIPFTETRTYVMRVVESVVIYRAKLRGSVGPVRVTSELKG